MPELSKDTVMCISLSGRPSNLGTRFHNFLYGELGLDFAYKAFATDDIEGAIRGVRALGIRGCSVSMPHKQAVLRLVDHVEESAANLGAANTIVNDGGVLTASNTDVVAVEQLTRERGLDTSAPVIVRGAGGMAAATIAGFRRAGFGDVTVWARLAESGRAVAERFGIPVTVTEPLVSGAVLANATPIGMEGTDRAGVAFSEQALALASGVLDAVAFPWRTPLVETATAAGLPVVTGADIFVRQATLQFIRYTGVTPSAEQVARAAEHARASQ